MKVAAVKGEMKAVSKAVAVVLVVEGHNHQEEPEEAVVASKVVKTVAALAATKGMVAAKAEEMG